jgi:hypothetical protein
MTPTHNHHRQPPTQHHRPLPSLPVVHNTLVELPFPLSLGPLVSGEFWSPDSDIDPQNLRSWAKASAPLRPGAFSTSIFCDSPTNVVKRLDLPETTHKG